MHVHIYTAVSSFGLSGGPRYPQRQPGGRSRFAWKPSRSSEVGSSPVVRALAPQ